MSYKEEGKKASFKPKYQEKNKVVSKFNFVFDQQKVNFKTQIPDLPAKAKAKPDQKGHQKKVQQIQKRIDTLKQQRKKMKQNIHKGSQNFDEEIKKYKNNVDIGKKCLVVLKYDLENITKSLTQIQEKIAKKTKLIKNLQRGPRQNKQQRKSYEQMTYEQLQNEQYKLSTRMSLANLNKKEQTEINTLIAKIARLKMNAPHGQKPKDNTIDIQNAQDSLNRLRFVKQNLQQQENETKYKIEAIQEDIQDFKDQIVDLEQQKKNPENEALYQQSQSLKNQIYKLREQISKLQQDFQQKKAEYDYEQAKIQWIKWATEIQKKKNEEWEAGREQRRRQKLKQKNKQKIGEGKDNEEKKEGELTEGQIRPERPKINKYQKQIDNFTFLISYCNGLTGKEQQSVKKEGTKEETKNIEQVLKSGEWSKLKDVQVIKSKKANLDEQVSEKPKKKKLQKNKQTDPSTTAQSKPTNFVHNIFIQQLFDSAKILPPTKPEQIQNILKELNSKLTYFLDHPEGGIETDKQKQKYTAQKYAKAKYNPRQKKVVNTEDFPSLS